MMRLVTAACAVGLFVVPVLTTALPAVAGAGGLGLLLAGLGIATRWRWPTVAAACVFATAYAAALWIERPGVGVPGATGVGFALALLLQSAEIARCGRGAAVDAAFVRARAGGWLRLGALTLGAALLLAALAGSVAGTLPYAAAPLVAAAGGLGVVLALAALLSASGRTASRAS